MEILTFAVGFILGVVVVALAMEFGFKKPRKEPSTRSTKSWSLAELHNPRILAEYLGDVDIPRNSRLLVNQYHNNRLFTGVEVRQHSDIKGNFVLGDDRALILAGPLKRDEIGVWTVEKDILEKLGAYFEAAWENGTEIKPPEKR
ncbi:MAG: hypothetical protein V1726_05225 [Methanobacteriota archaeon]